MTPATYVVPDPVIAPVPPVTPGSDSEMELGARLFECFHTTEKSNVVPTNPLPGVAWPLLRLITLPNEFVQVDAAATGATAGAMNPITIARATDGARNRSGQRPRRRVSTQHDRTQAVRPRRWAVGPVRPAPNGGPSDYVGPSVG